MQNLDTNTHTKAEKEGGEKNPIFTHFSTSHSTKKRLEAHTTLNKVLRTKAIRRKVVDKLLAGEGEGCAKPQALKQQRRRRR